MSPTIPTEVAAVLAEMRARKVNHDKHTSPTLIAWADRIESALTKAEAVATYNDQDVLDEVRAMVKLCFETQADFAKSRNVSPAYVSDVLNGRRAMPEQWAVLAGFSRPKWFRDTPKRWADVAHAPPAVCQTCNDNGAVGSGENSQPCPTCAVDERALFEMWHPMSDLSRESDGGYENECVGYLWSGWKKRAAVERKRMNFIDAAVPVESSDQVVELLLAGGFIDKDKLRVAREIIADCKKPAVPVASVPDGWRDIYSIPKDETRVELLAANGKRDFGNYYHIDNPSYGFMEHLNTDGGHGDYTHWRPLATNQEGAAP